MIRPSGGGCTSLKQLRLRCRDLRALGPAARQQSKRRAALRRLPHRLGRRSPRGGEASDGQGDAADDEGRRGRHWGIVVVIAAACARRPPAVRGVRTPRTPRQRCPLPSRSRRRGRPRSPFATPPPSAFGRALRLALGPKADGGGVVMGRAPLAHPVVGASRRTDHQVLNTTARVLAKHSGGRRERSSFTPD